MQSAVAPPPSAFTVSARPPCPPGHGYTWAPIFNMGLPRTGTTAFTAASKLLGLRASHVCESFQNAKPMKALGSCVYNGTIAGRCESRRSVHDFDSLSDSPWFMLDRHKLARAYPFARFVCTTRHREDWVKSMVGFAQRTGYPAGGEVLMWFATSRIGKSVAKRGRGQVPLPDRLAEFFDVHMNTTCGDGVKRISLNDPSETRWRAVCAAVSTTSEDPQVLSKCWEQISQARPWPVERSVENQAASRRNNATR